MTERKAEHELALGRDAGLFPGIPFPEYARAEAANHSTLKAFDRSALHAHEAIVHPGDETKAQHVGTAIHTAVLEPERYAVEYLVTPKFDRRTKAGREAWASFEAEHASSEFLTKAEDAACFGMQTACYEHPTARAILDGEGVNEVVAVWDDPDTGTRCKARYDRLTTLGEWSVIADLKSTKDASPRAFARDAARYSYHTAAAHYLDGAYTLAPRARRHIIIAVENVPPYAVAVYELDTLAIEQGRNDVKRWLRMYAEARRTNTWPGYGPGVQSLELPRWAINPEGWTA